MIYFMTRLLAEDPKLHGVTQYFTAPDGANLAATVAAAARHMSPEQPRQHVQMTFLERFPSGLPVTILTTEETRA